MSTNQIIVGLIIAVVVLGGAFLFFGKTQEPTMMGDDAMMESDSMMEKDNAMREDNGAMEGDIMMKDDGAMMEKGTYEAYAPEKLIFAESGKVVLFFHADWCPICRPLDAEIVAKGVPVGVKILKVDYDNSAELKKKYGVTLQHTFVQVDAQGGAIAKWSDSTTLPQVLAKLQ